MIHSIELHNFQGWVDQTIELSPGLNIIQGATNSGKTSVLRAFRWVFYGEGDWKSLRRNGTKEVSVLIRDAQGTVVKRTRTSSENRYELWLPDGTYHKLDSVGRSGVPDPVVEAFGLKTTRLDKERERSSVALNVSGQHDPLFLLSDGPQAIHRQLGVLTYTDELEMGARNSSTWATRAERTVGEKEQQEQALTAQIDRLQNLAPAEEEMARVNLMLERTAGLAAEVAKAQDTLSWLYTWRQRSVSLQEMEKKLLGFDAEKWSAYLTSYEQRAQQVAQGGEFIGFLTRWQQEDQTLRTREVQVSHELQRLEADLATVQSCPLCGAPAGQWHAHD